MQFTHLSALAVAMLVSSAFAAPMPNEGALNIYGRALSKEKTALNIGEDSGKGLKSEVKAPEPASEPATPPQTPESQAAAPDQRETTHGSWRHDLLRGAGDFVDGTIQRAQTVGLIGGAGSSYDGTDSSSGVADGSDGGAGSSYSGTDSSSGAADGSDGGANSSYDGADNTDDSLHPDPPAASISPSATPSAGGSPPGSKRSVNFNT